MNARQVLDGLPVTLPVPPGLLFVGVLGVGSVVRLLSLSAAAAEGAPTLAFLFLAGAGFYLAVLVGLWHGFGWGWYGTIVTNMLWTLEAAVRYDWVFVVLWFLAVEYLYDSADRYVNLDELSLFRAPV